jgi:hypothetical protein
MTHEFKDLKQIPRQEQKSPQTFKFGEPVVNSDSIKWKPIDCVAARVVAPAHWACEPPQPEPKFMKPEKSDKFPDAVTGPVKMKRGLTDSGYVEELVSLDSVAPLAVATHEHTLKEGLKVSEELLSRANDVISTIDYLTTQIRGPWAEHQAFVKAALAEVREQRIALGSETRLLMSALKDVRQFFLEEAYETEVRRLHEFIDLCERLKALKEEGTLDAVADTILKMSAQ